MPQYGVVDGLAVPKRNQEEKLASTVNLYIGIFFEGTNNNKYQVMLGKMFRWKEIYKKHRLELKKHIKGWDVLEYSEVNMYSISEYPRAYWESGPGKDIFSKSELEFMYFGYGDINATSSWRSSFIEQKSLSALEGKDIHQLSAKPDNSKEKEKLIDVASGIINSEEGNSWIKDKWKGRLTNRSVKGAPAQNTTYTNVAILESLYKCGDKTCNEEITERHVSMYIEGSGSDMQLEASTKIKHKASMELAGLGLGTGPSGVAAKVRKASIMVQRLLDQYIVDEVKEINFYFDLFGFSRGSTCARVMAYVINPENSEASSITNKKDKGSEYKFFTSKASEFLPSNYIGKTLKKEIRFMGLFDTVSSIGVKDEKSLAETLARILDNAVGKVKDPDKKDTDTIWKSIQPYITPSLQALGFLADLKLNTQVLDKMGEMIGYSLPYLSTKLTLITSKYKELVKNILFKKDKGTEDLTIIPEGKEKYHRYNVRDYGLWATKFAKEVVHVCAMDEVRKNFALVDIESSINKNGTEIFIPGCHTDIGGGASIGIEEEKIINKKNNRFLTCYHVHKKSEIKNTGDSQARPISVKTLKEIGWINFDSKSTDIFHKTSTGRSLLKEDETYYSENYTDIILYRHVTPGYSNVALNYVRNYAATRIGVDFDYIPGSYRVPNDLSNLLSAMESKTKGRYFVYPREPEQYYELRKKYIHLSFNEQILDLSDNNLVNGPEYVEFEINKKNKVISRIIYPGALNNMNESLNPKHMFDYGDS